MEIMAKPNKLEGWLNTIFNTPLDQLEEWINTPLIMDTRYGRLDGEIKYGIRFPLRPATNPLVECELGSKDKIEGEKARYWFVNDERGLKIRLVTQRVVKSNLKGVAYDCGLFRYVISRK